MRLHCVAVDRLRFAPYRAACDEYCKRLRRLAPLDVREVKPARGRLTPPQLRAQEAERILGALPTRGALTLVALDERGERFTSEAFARWIKQRFDAAAPPCFVIGGATGLDPSVRERAALVLQLSEMTLPHELARVFLFEQLYRAMTIERGIPYHK